MLDTVGQTAQRGWRWGHTAQLVSWGNETEPLVREAQPAGRRERGEGEGVRVTVWPGLPFLDPHAFATGRLGRYPALHVTHALTAMQLRWACHSASRSPFFSHRPCHVTLASLRPFDGKLHERTLRICGTVVSRGLLVLLKFAKLPSEMLSLLFPSHRRTRCPYD